MDISPAPEPACDAEASRPTGYGSPIPAVLALAISALLLRILLTGEVAVFIGRSTRPLLWVSAVILAVVGAWAFVPILRGLAMGGSGQQHRRVWVLSLVPILAIGLGGPGPLQLAIPRAQAKPNVASGTPSPGGNLPGKLTPARVDPQTGRTEGGYGAGTDQNEKNQEGTSRAMAIDGAHGELKGNPAVITVYDYVARSQMAPDTLKGKTVQIEGFASRDPDSPNGPWVLVRFRVWCCAADALPFMITAENAPQPKLGSWVRVTGKALPATRAGDARLEVTKVEPIPEPEDPYLY